MLKMRSSICTNVEQLKYIKTVQYANICKTVHKACYRKIYKYLFAGICIYYV